MISWRYRAAQIVPYVVGSEYAGKDGQRKEDHGLV